MLKKLATLTLAAFFMSLPLTGITLAKGPEGNQPQQMQQQQGGHQGGQQGGGAQHNIAPQGGAR